MESNLPGMDAPASSPALSPGRIVVAFSPVLVIALVLSAGAALHLNADVLPFNTAAFMNIGEVLAPLVAISAFIERAVEVLLTTARNEESNRLQTVLDQSSQDPTQTSRTDEARARLQAYKSQTQRLAFLLSVGLGVLAGLLGVRALSNLLAKDAHPVPAFEILDIALTGLVIGGGADGIHKIVKAVTDYMEMISRKSQAAPGTQP
jgi:hypothetical protein